VLDVSQWLPGPHAALVMADLGADVIKIEPPAGDPMRGMEPREADGVAAEYKATNGSKRVLRLDLKSPAGAGVLRQLVGYADVLIESYRPGVLDRLGFSPAALQKLNPRLIHTALSGWGWTGPYAQRAGHDINYLAVGGGLYYSGGPDRPSLMRSPVADFASALTAVIATLAALQRRHATGQGGFVDVSLMESVLAWQAELFIADHLGQTGGRGEAMLTGGAAYYNIYGTSDGGFVSLGAIEAKFWRGFCEAVERPDWIDRQNEPLPQTVLVAEVAALFAARPRAEWQALLEPVDCCFEAVLTATEMRGHAHILARGLVQDRGDHVDVQFPAFVDGQPPRPRAPVTEIDANAALKSWGE
jgi:crotonobetainyl-CoA:carnitine CoA-transferase CaiB-like acyl-CoA transferase